MFISYKFENDPVRITYHLLAVHVPLEVEVQPAGVPLIVTEKEPEAEVEEPNVPDTPVLPVTENEFPVIVYEVKKFVVAPV